MDHSVWLAGIGVGLLLLVAVIRWLRHFGEVVQAERARELFRLQHERFEEALLKAASEKGKPRGLRWVSCLITGDALLVRDTSLNKIVAMVPVEVRFEPAPGSDMEDVPAAHEPRPTTAIFAFSKGEWLTEGRVIFNLDPHQTVRQSAGHYEELHH